VLKVISSSPTNVQPVFDTIAESAVRLCDGQFSFVVRFDGKIMDFASYCGLSAEGLDAFRSILPMPPTEDTASGRAIVRREVVEIPDVEADPTYGATGQGLAKAVTYRSIAAAPLLHEGNPIGAIAVARANAGPFPKRQIVLLQAFADQAVIAIGNVRLFDEVQARTRDLTESLEQQTATSEVLKIISSSPGELAPVFRAMLENATHICDASYGVMFIREGTGFRSAAMHNLPRALVEERRRAELIEPITDDPLGQLAATKQKVHITDARTEAAYRRGFAPFVALVDDGGARTLLAMPLLREDELIGAFSIYRQEVKPFTDKQIDLLKNFAAQAVIAIENTRLLNELRESLAQQTATADVLKVISRSTFNLQTVLDTLVESAARLCEADMASINREKGDAYRQVANYGHSPELQTYMDSHPIPAGRGSVVGRTVMQGKIIHIPDVLADPDYKMTGAAQLGGIHTMLGVPLLREGTPIGVIVLQRKAIRPFTEKQIELVETFADQAVIAIENVRLFQSVETRTRELAKSLEDLRTAQDRLVQTEKLASLGQLTAGIAHEIKNPLNFVNNFSGVSAELIDELRETLRRVKVDDSIRTEITELTDTLRSNLDKVVQHGKRADAIVKNMLLHSRQGSQEHRPVDINAIVEESLNLAYHGARAEKQGFNITLERSLDPTVGEVDVFPQDITRVLLNLISNGFYAATKRKAETDGGGYEPTLAAATRNLGNSVEISIRDNGTGIPPDVKAKLFSPFFTTKPVGEGTGLGLSISHDIIVKQHGGSIEVDTQPGEFTEFRIVLPRGAASIAKSGGSP
jgi:two-component system NtrC family sensor kinase